MPVLMELSRVIVSDLNDQQAMYLREVGGTRMFPILIGQFEAQAINRQLLEEEPFRPMTHQLLKNVVAALGGVIEEVMITEMKEHTYFAVFDGTYILVPHWQKVSPAKSCRTCLVICLRLPLRPPRTALHSSQSSTGMMGSI